MPSIGVATAIIVSRRIDDGINAAFEEEKRSDVYKLLDLSSRGGDKNNLTITAVFGGILTGLIAEVFGYITAAVFWTSTLLACYWMHRRRKNAQREFNALIASNPEYWSPISEKLEQIVRTAGQFDDGMHPAQATRIVR